MRDVGEIGENVLGQWAAQVGITANRVQRDRTGWDVLLELPTEVSSVNAPIDYRPHPVQCLVQVKSTDERPGLWAIKLDNWFRFITTPLPAFFLILEFDGEKDCQRAFLVHVDEVLIRKVLTRVRKLSVSLPQVALHTKTMSFPYGIEHVLASNDGTGLLNAIKHHVGIAAKYVLAKQDLLRSIGYEHGRELIVAQLGLPKVDQHKSLDDALVDWSLGLAKDAVIAPGAKVYDDRFGILFPDPIHVIPTKGRVEPQPKHGLLRFRTLDEEQERAFEVEIYSSGTVKGYVPEEKHMIRVAAAFGDLFIPVADPTAARFSLRIPSPNSDVRLSDLRPLSEFVLLCKESASGQGLELDLRSDGPPLRAVIDVAEIRDDLVQLARAVRCALRLAAQLQFPKDIPTRIDELFEQYKELELMDAALRKETLGVHVTFVYPAGILNEQELACFPAVLDAQIGDRMLVVAVASIGRPGPTGVPDEGLQAFEMIVTSMKVCYTEVTTPGVLPERLPLELLQQVADSHPALPIIRWWEYVSGEM